jgi:hypothetical protein
VNSNYCFLAVVVVIGFTDQFLEQRGLVSFKPLSRERARAVINKLCAQAAHINDAWRSNPFQIRTVAVSGHYMSAGTLFPNFRLWVFSVPTPGSANARWRACKGSAKHYVTSSLR